MARVTQLHIAKALNISRSTVATVFSQAPGGRISKEVSDRVVEMADRLGYRPNRYAQVMRNGRSGYIGILGFNSLRELSQRKIVAAQAALQRHQYDWIVQERHNIATDLTEATNAQVERLIDARVEGVLLAYPDFHLTAEMLQRIHNEGIPVVGIASDSLKGIPNFVSDRFWGYSKMLQHLICGGYRRLALLGINEGTSKAAFDRCLEEHPGITGSKHFVDRRQFATKEHPPEYRDYLCAKHGMEKILQGKGPLPEVVVCNNDSWALGAMTACYEAGLSVPGDIAITGFDNDVSGAFGAVPLTTMRHPIEEIATQAIDLLMEMVRSNTLKDDRIIAIPGELIVRSSCGLSQSHSPKTHQTP